MVNLIFSFIFAVTILFVNISTHAIIKPALISNKGPITKDFIRQYLPKNPIILEAGAHNGNDTVLFASTIHGSRIYAFEPVPDLYSQLKKNTAKYPNISCFQLALSDTNGFATLNVSHGLDHGSSSLLNPKEHLIVFPQVQFNKKILVNTKTLDQWAEENNVKKIDFLWLDMQGFEPRMLKASPKILSTVKVIYTEVNTVELYKGAILYSEYNKWLQEQGFTLVREEVSPHFGGDALFVRF